MVVAQKIDKVKREDLIYTAGLFDGEASVGIYSYKRKEFYYTMSVRLTNTNLEVLEWLKITFGGSVNPYKKKEGRKQAYQWTISSNQALLFLRLIQPFIKIKKEQANLAIEFQSTKRHRNGGVIVPLSQEEKDTYRKYAQEVKRFNDYRGG